MLTELRVRLAAGLRALRRMAGMPDYERFVDHRRRHHANEPMPSEREYFAEYVTARYGDSPTRCC
jgi:uncharacterized short protein YbdD (DUF466 family)